MKCLQGYTLLELLLSLSIVAFLSLMAFAAFRYCFSEVKTLLIIRRVTDELYLARSEALTKQQKTVYCNSNSGESSWDKERVIKQNGKIIHVFPSLPTNYHLTLHNSLNRNNEIVFTPLGFTAWERGTFYLETPNTEVKIIINISGRIRIVP